MRLFILTLLALAFLCAKLAQGGTLFVTPSVTAASDGVTGYNYYQLTGSNMVCIASNAPTTITTPVKFGQLFAATAVNSNGCESDLTFCVVTNKVAAPKQLQSKL